ncbi:hypothetical protein AB836_00620 [Rickettsiales bacterium (ex Bugula neritina AB1)]|nr:hypothetical protein AB836_00620 [Rickettsiales bacterium (ex Bugula neritina AB1)]
MNKLLVISFVFLLVLCFIFMLIIKIFKKKFYNKSSISIIILSIIFVYFLIIKFFPFSFGKIEKKFFIKKNTTSLKEEKHAELVSAFQVQLIEYKKDLKTYGTIHSSIEFDVINESSGKIIYINDNNLLKQDHIFLQFDEEYERILLKNQEEKESLQKEKIKNFTKLVEDNLIPLIKLNEAKYELNSIQTEIKKLEHKINMSKITAPKDGYFIKDENIDIGAFCTQNRKLGRFFSNSFIVTFYIDDEILKNINKEKDNVIFYLKDKSNPLNVFEGVIQDIYPLVDKEKNTNLHKCVALLKNTPNNTSLLFGKTGIVELTLDAKQKVLIIPETSIINYGPNYYVYVIQNGEAILTEVDCQERLKNGYVIISGIQEGMQVISDGTNKIFNHQKVNIYKSSK